MQQARATYFFKDRRFRQKRDEDEDGDQLMEIREQVDPSGDAIVPLDHMLHLAMLLCSHESLEDQVHEMWLLANPNLEDEIEADALHRLVSKLSEIAVLRTHERIVGLAPDEPVKRAQRH